MIFDPLNVLTVLFVMASITSFGVMLSSSATLFLVLRGIYAPRQLLGWRIAKMYHYDTRRLPPLVDLIMSEQGVLVVSIIRILSCIGLLTVLLTHQALSDFFLTILFLTTLYFDFRHPYSGDGQDQLQTILVFALFFAVVWPGTELAATLSLLFVGAQVVLAYTASAMAKILSRQWRTGTRPLWIISTEAFGRKSLAKLFQNYPALSPVFTFLVMITQLSVWLVLFLPFPYNTIPLIALATFHLTVAIIMRLNLFFWFFLAAYPALLFLAAHFQSFIYS